MSSDPVSGFWPEVSIQDLLWSDVWVQRDEITSVGYIYISMHLCTRQQVSGSWYFGAPFWFAQMKFQFGVEEVNLNPIFV